MRGVERIYQVQKEVRQIKVNMCYMCILYAYFNGTTRVIAVFLKTRSKSFVKKVCQKIRQKEMYVAYFSSVSTAPSNRSIDHPHNQ